VIEQAVRADALIGSTPPITRIPPRRHALPTPCIHNDRLTSCISTNRLLSQYLGTDPYERSAIWRKTRRNVLRASCKIAVRGECRDCSDVNTSGSKYVSAIFVNGKDGYEVFKWSGALTVGV